MLSCLINDTKPGRGIKIQLESILICNTKLNIFEWSVPSQSNHSCQK